jgi:hypothetical protein
MTAHGRVGRKLTPAKVVEKKVTPGLALLAQKSCGLHAICYFLHDKINGKYLLCHTEF